MKKLLILLLWANFGLTETNKNQVDLENISTDGLDKDVASVFAETKALIIKSRSEKDTQLELLGTKKWCYLLHNFSFLEQAKNCYFLIGMDAKNEATWPYLYGKAALEQGNVEDALKGFLQTINRDSNYLPAHYYLIQLSIENGDLLQAFKLNGNVPANLKLTAKMLDISGDLYTQVENYHVANGFYKQALSLAPQSNRINYKIAQNYQRLEQSEMAEKYFGISGQFGISLIDPYYQQVKDTTVGEVPYLIQAKKALSNNDYKQAISLYTKAIEFNPKSKSARTNIAVAFFQDGQIEKSQNLFETLIAEYPDNLKLIYNLATIAQSKNNSNLAIEYFERYRKINIQDKFVNRELAELYYQNKSYDNVIEIGSEALLADDEKMQLLKAKSFVHTEKYSKAVELLTQINKHKPNNNEVLLLLAKLFSQVPDMDIRNSELSLMYAKQAFENNVNLLSYWQLIMALDESNKCDELDNTISEFSQSVNLNKKQIKSKLSIQRGNELRCKFD